MELALSPELWGTFFLVVGLALAARPFAAAAGLERAVVLGPVFVAAPLAAFAAEHFGGAVFVSRMVPAWIPWPLFWAYFVGVALVATAASFVSRRCLRLSAPLFALMVALFVLTMHLPNALRHLDDRFAWAIALRDLAFAAGALAFGVTRDTASGPSRDVGVRSLTSLAACLVAVALAFFGIEQLLHPAFAPGVPLPMQTPELIPLRPLWGYLTGILELGAAISLLLGAHARRTLSVVALWLAALSAFLYGPILALAAAPKRIEALNYVADTLMFAGTLLLLAASLRDSEPERSAGRPRA